MLEIIIPMPALSMNNSHMSLRRGGRIKRPETRLYENEFSRHLGKYTDEIIFFLREFNKGEMGISADYEFYFPREQYYTKRGKLNLKKLPDTDNLIKITQDLIFSQLIDDSHVIELSARKLPTSQDAYIKVSLEAMELPRETFGIEF